MQELTETTLKNFIANGKTIIKVWDDNCPYCNEYAPIFQTVADNLEADIKFGTIKIPRGTPSAFRRKYMKTPKGEEKNSVPATFIFENGELKHTAWGRMFEPQLVAFIATGEQPSHAPAKPITIEEYASKASDIELKASIFDEMVKIENSQKVIQLFNAELARRVPNR